MNFILWSPYRNECDNGIFQKAYKNEIFQVILKFDSNEDMVASWSIDHLHHQKPFLWCSLSRPVHHVIFLQNQLSSCCCRIYTCTWLFFKTMGPPEGSSKPREHPRVLLNDVRRNRASTNKLILHSFFHLYIFFVVEFYVKFLFHLLLNILLKILKVFFCLI